MRFMRGSGEAGFPANLLQKQQNDPGARAMPRGGGLLCACKFPANAGEQLHHTQRA
jgi:hypothetical protein